MSVKFKAYRLKFTAKKKTLEDCLSDGYFIILCYFKPEKLKYNFLTSQMLRIACGVQSYYYFVTAFCL